MRKKDAATDVGSEWSAAPAGSGGWMTPADVQEKEFHVTRVGAGYRMREVDEFLDQITDTLSALITENDRLRGTAGPGRAASLPMTRPRAADPEDRGAVEAFLQREKGFLQDLGGLVQAHTEELRSMVRTVRRDAVPPAASPEAPVAEPMAAAPPSGTIEPPPEPEPDPEPGSEQEHTDPPATSDRDDDRAAPATIAPVSVTQADGDEPILLEEPEPARSRRSEEDEGNSLRELFWGEE
jgi:DivIVA domain-containing protein